VPFDAPVPKPCIFVGASRRELKVLPAQVQKEIGYALYEAQCGDKPISAKPLKGFGGAGVLEIVENFVGDTYRAVYTVRFAEAVYVLHAFQKKSKRGIATSKATLEIIRTRMRAAEDYHRERHGTGDRKP
jgi:phage-related protein